MIRTEYGEAAPPSLTLRASRFLVARSVSEGHDEWRSPSGQRSLQPYELRCPIRFRGLRRFRVVPPFRLPAGCSSFSTVPPRRSICSRLGTVRIALHHHRPIAQVQQKDFRHRVVIAKQVPFRDPQLRPEQFSQVRQPHDPARDVNFGLIDTSRNSVRARNQRARPSCDERPGDKYDLASQQGAWVVENANDMPRRAWPDRGIAFTGRQDRETSDRWTSVDCDRPI